MGLCLFINVKLLPQLKGIKFIFCESWWPSRICFQPTFAYHCNVCYDKNVRDGSLMELLYVDDLVFFWESLDEIMDKYGRWKNAVERKGQKVNFSKTKGM